MIVELDPISWYTPWGIQDGLPWSFILRVTVIEVCTPDDRVPESTPTPAPAPPAAPDPEPTDGRGLRPPTENPAFPPPRTGYGPNCICAPYHTTSFSGANGEDNECVIPLNYETVFSKTATEVSVTCFYKGYCASGLQYDPPSGDFLPDLVEVTRSFNVTRKK